jgi:MoxR-like ATPase
MAADDFAWQLTKDGGTTNGGRWRSLPSPAMADVGAPSGYLASQDTVDAVNVAIHLGLPLLVMGEPGCGKTVLADWVADQLETGCKAIHFSTRSTVTAQDLFYNFDAVGRFHAKAEMSDDPRRFISFVGLGEAIVRALDRERRIKLVAPDHLDRYAAEPVRSVVLIDEIDKASRDFPNDLLSELENFCFTIPELGGLNVTAPKELRPIVIITSNAERSLPDAFLRRCVFLHMKFPDAELETIVTQRIGAMKSAPRLVNNCITVLRALREADARLTKPPSTAELLAFVLTLPRHGYGPDKALERGGRWIEDAMLTLVKDDERARAKAVLEKLDPDGQRPE